MGTGTEARAGTTRTPESGRERPLSLMPRSSRRFRRAAFAGALLVWSAAGCASRSYYQEGFQSHLDRGWSIRREDRSAWRLSPQGLEVRVLPGNMWGPANDAKNTFVRSAPDPAKGPVDVSVRVENHPTEQYEQVDLLWHYTDSDQVKIGQELVDGKLSIVMGREEKDRTRTLAIIPLDSFVVDLRLEVTGTTIRGLFRTPAMKEWREAGTCDLPVNGSPNISFQIYQGPAHVEHWAKLSHFELTQWHGPRR